MRVRLGEPVQDKEGQHKTADSTFKPKSLRNRAKERVEAEEKRRREAEERRMRRRSYLDPPLSFQVSLRPTGINENASRKPKTNRFDFKKKKQLEKKA